MSTATPFRFKGMFPFIPEMSGLIPSYFNNNLDNLTFADVCEFAWNLENFELTTEGNLDYGGGITIDGNSVTSINPMTSNRFTVGSQDGGMWFGDALSSVAFGSWPAIRQPNNRITEPSGITLIGTLLNFGATYGPSPADADCQFAFIIELDPINTGRFRLYYHIGFHFTDPATNSTDLRWQSEPMGAGMTPWNSGTINIGGFSFDWYSGYNGSPTPSGSGALSATSLSFTY